MTQRPVIIPQMEEEDKDLELRSEEVKEIMGNPPSWIIRWGSTVAFGVVALLLFFAWLIHWPDVRPAPIELTTAIPPSEIVSTFDGTVERIMVKSGDPVKRGKLLVVLQSTGDFADILMLREELVDLEEADEVTILEYSPDPNYQLGELTPGYTTFVENLDAFSRSTTSQFVSQSVNQLMQTKRAVQASIRSLESKLRSYHQDMKNERTNQERLKKLYQDGIVSQLELEKAYSRILAIKANMDELDSRIFAKKQELTRINQEIIGLKNTKEETTSFDYTRFTQEIYRLQSAIDKWEEKYLLRAPIDGIISFPDATKEYQYVKQGEPILNVLPDKGGGWICVGQLPAAGSAKVEEGQEVIIKFENYPFEEYGSVKGFVSEIALMPTGNTYHLEIELEDGLNTTYGKSLNYNQGMAGVAEILVEEKRLLELLFEKLVSKVRRR